MHLVSTGLSILQVGAEPSDYLITLLHSLMQLLLDVIKIKVSFMSTYINSITDTHAFLKVKCYCSMHFYFKQSKD